MSVNSSSSSNSSLDSLILFCLDLTTSQIISNTFNITRVCLLLPVSIFILFLGHRQWRQHRSFRAMSHSDVFTYHNAVLELICSVGAGLFLYGVYCDVLPFRTVGNWIACLMFSGEASFHLLTCAERYLAVVHPITYRGLRNSRGVRIRNISIGCAWLLSFAWSTITTLQFLQQLFIPVFSFLVFSLVIVCFCSLSALCVLIRPGPGEGGVDRQRVDQSKHRAFLTIMAITGVLLFWFVGFLVCLTLGLSRLLCYSQSWVVLTSGYWFMMPSSLMLPLLYLLRTGKPPCCLSNTG